MITKAISKLYQFRHLSGLVLLACLWVTGFQAYSEKQKIDQAAIEQFHDEANHVASKIEERLRDYALILRGGAGLFTASGQVTHEEWSTYTQLLNVSASVSGIQTLSFVAAIPAQQLAAHVASMRADGFPHYTVSPSGTRDMYAPLTYLAPVTKHNQSIIGVDMFTRPINRATMERARDTGQVTLSPFLQLKEDDAGP
ncbi:MAG: CHASE domain-containing protein, partial [Methylotenera sp.]|nr:CHASE domain-containing protein [Methylotenera sp.]